MWKIFKMKFDNFMNTCGIINGYSSYNMVDWKLSFKNLNHLLLLSQLQATICAGSISSLTHQFSQHFMLIRAECQVCNHYILNHSTNFGEIRCCLAACLHMHTSSYLPRILSSTPCQSSANTLQNLQKQTPCWWKPGPIIAKAKTVSLRHIHL